MKPIDAVTLTVIRSGLQQICSEMDLVHEKAAFSPIIAEAFDRSNGIYAADTGEVIAQGELGLPIFMGVMQETTRAVLTARGRDARPGDIFIVNDPYLGGTHLQDVKMVKPFFFDGVLWCWLSNTGHWPDTGGMVPGGFSSEATEIHQEGLRIPPLKLVRAGLLDQDIVDLVLANIRVPDERIGDIQAQIGALTIGERRLTAFLDRHGEPVVRAAIAELANRAETQMRAHIASIPDGIYRATAIVDSDGVVNRPLEIAISMTVAGDGISVDFSDSSSACAGPLNSTWACTRASVYVAMKHIFPDVPTNAGCFRPIEVRAPKGTFLYAEYPRPVSGCAAEVAQRIMEAVFAALGPAISDRMFACPAGTTGNFGLGGWDPRVNKPYVLYLFSGGGYGGWWENDGISNGCSTVGISKTQPLELLEHRYPIRFEKYALREGSGGAGRHRGGFGVEYRVRLLAGEAVASFLMDHGRVGPPGLLGGEAGAVNRITVRQGDREFVPEHLSKGEGYALTAGDWVEVATPGGGGYGVANQRPSHLIERDVLRQYYTKQEIKTRFAD